MSSYPTTPTHVNGKAISPEQHSRMYGGAAVERDEYGLLLYALEDIRSKPAQALMSDAQLADADREPQFTDWRS